jgi:molybdate transport system regulatory protein
MEVSARNQLAGKVTAIKLGGVMAEVTVDIGGGNEVVAAVTRTSVENLKLEEGTPVVAIIKATEVLIGKP